MAPTECLPSAFLPACLLACSNTMVQIGNLSLFLLSTWSIFWAGLVKGIILRTLFPLALFSFSTPSWLKVVGGVVANVIILTASVQRIGFWDFSDLVWT